ncbi:hypothetical protein EB19_00442 [Enterococcus faecium]|nr:hypothetical protein EB15_00452 [Enterococcus faecium]RBS43248.1 hypothetical protein EB19_00442 [Enterococcus faecium]RBS58406.1 hypothetical protein EB27_00332 [Enterococcus faecium]RBT26921.1 hypothetical protein EA99_00333 [Enterococcus faecium]
MKIIVIGQSGSGKSSLARKIKEITGFPHSGKKVVFARTAIVYSI